jgi:hypothetical protein
LRSRIGDGEALDAGNIQIIGQSSNDTSADSGRNPDDDRNENLCILGLARVLAHGIVESPLLRMTKRRAFLRALSQNGASASRVSLC